MGKDIFIEFKTKLFVVTLVALLGSCTLQKKIEFPENHTFEDNATLIIMAYPQEVVRTTEAFYSNLLPLLGMGIKGYIRGGHACMVLIKDGSEKYEYFDLGRYISPEGYARARGANTDPETTVDIKAVWKNGEITNIEELLRWLYDHPKKTRGYGDLYASVCKKVNYERVVKYIDKIQDKGIVKYGPFERDGSNCARFVTDAMLNGVLDENMLDDVDDLYNLTPSVLGNIEAANSYDYYYVTTQDSIYKSKRNLEIIQLDILVDNSKGYDHIIDCQKGQLIAPDKYPIDKNWQWLGGIGYGVWYEIEQTEYKDIYCVTQYSAERKIVFTALYKAEKTLDLSQKYKFEYPSHYEMITLNIDSQKIDLVRIVNESTLPALQPLSE